MTEWLELRDAVEVWGGAHHPIHGGIDDPYPQWVEQVMDHFPDLVDFVGKRLPSICGRQHLAAQVAVMALGPETGEPSPDLWAQLKTQLQDRLATDADDRKVLDLVVAYGCARRREISAEIVLRNRTANLWEGRWYGTMYALIRLVDKSLHQSMGLMPPIRPQLPKNLSDFAPPIAMWLSYDKCQCGKHKAGCKNEDCGCCRDEHKLSNWEPEVCTLQGYIANAVRGSATRNLLVGAFAQCMIFSILKEEHGLLVDYVEFKICHQCLAEYEGSACSTPDCRTPVDRRLTKHIRKKNRLIIPWGRGGDYILRQRCVCPSESRVSETCGNLYPFKPKNEVCPNIEHDGGPPPRRPARAANVWVYAPGIPYQDFMEDTFETEDADLASDDFDEEC